MPITTPIIRGDIEREIQLRAIEDSSPDSIWSRVLEWIDQEIEARAEVLVDEWDNDEIAQLYGEIGNLTRELEDAEDKIGDLEDEVAELRDKLAKARER